MTEGKWPDLDVEGLAQTRQALSGYAKILGAHRRERLTPRKHWWHISLRPWLTGFETGPIRVANGAYNLVLNTRDSRIEAMTAAGANVRIPLTGQPATDVSDELSAFLKSTGLAAAAPNAVISDQAQPAYVADAARAIGDALDQVATQLEVLRHGIREETSPVQLWPHHFDLAMLWLSGGLIAGKDPADAEQSDEQLNLGFALGDVAIDEAYFYIAPYPFAAAWNAVEPAPPARWHREGFTGQVLLYRELRASDNPSALLYGFWQAALDQARRIFA